MIKSIYVIILCIIILSIILIVKKDSISTFSNMGNKCHSSLECDENSLCLDYKCVKIITNTQIQQKTDRLIDGKYGMTKKFFINSLR